MKFTVTIHKQTATVVEIEDAPDAEAAIMQAHSGGGTVISQKTISAQFIPQEAT